MRFFSVSIIITQQVTQSVGQAVCCCIKIFQFTGANTHLEMAVLARREREKDIEYKVLINNTNNKFKLKKKNKKKQTLQTPSAINRTTEIMIICCCHWVFAKARTKPSNMKYYASIWFTVVMQIRTGFSRDKFHSWVRSCDYSILRV